MPVFFPKGNFLSLVGPHFHNFVISFRLGFYSQIQKLFHSFSFWQNFKYPWRFIHFQWLVMCKSLLCAKGVLCILDFDKRDELVLWLACCSELHMYVVNLWCVWEWMTMMQNLITGMRTKRRDQLVFKFSGLFFFSECSSTFFVYKIVMVWNNIQKSSTSSSEMKK